MALTEANVPSDLADQHDSKRMCEECGADMKPVGKLPAVSMHPAIKVFRCFKCDNVASEPALRVRAFSSQGLPRTGCEVDTGSREENGSKQKIRASVLIQSEPKRL